MPRQEGNYVPVRVLSCFLLMSGFWACSSPPNHPRSELPYLPPDLVEWIWSGAITATSAVVKARFTESIPNPMLRVHPIGNPAAVQEIPASSWNGEFRIAEFRPLGLAADTEYRYVASGGEREETARIGVFKTLPEEVRSFQIAFGACAESGSNGRVFETIRDLKPLLFLHLGDFHYANLRATEPGPYLQAISHALASPAQSSLYRSIPIAYIWDDHDYGPNHSGRTHPGKQASSLAHRLAVPHYQLGTDDGPIYQAFSIGNVRFILTDSRFERDPPESTLVRSLLGEKQKRWFKKEVRQAAATHPLLVWVNTIPWIGSNYQNVDGWGGFPEERRELAEFLESEGLPNVIMLSGDAHMLAIDDGSHSAYGKQLRGFPVFHAASLDRQGSVKGGPYSHGTLPGGGYFGLMEIAQTESQFRILWSGRNWQNQELLSYQFNLPKKTP